ncbi:acyl-CoA dehydrogenase family protein [Mangrovihabitans endophyticus]|uniref:Acyl-CoA dehydrogenase n=1 Tax=Mangrovihabitans endophyticus TaxID=1751298 RepID=A0A8J3FMU7_9ACTN|nr:acyl-CoA dehydrogenase family protein [Mangrovihabitans endophyticus]GGK78986.1 acyl-CoA dehydrogenase [Mangrovihabitans endophyticus]
MSEPEALVTGIVGDQAEEWDRTGRIPIETLRELGKGGWLCAQVGTAHGGPGLDSLRNGRFTAHVGSLCSSLRSVMTSQGMAAWIVQRLGGAGQRATLLPALAAGTLAAVGFSEPGAGSDLGAMATTIRDEGDTVVVDGRKMWITAAAYADLLVLFGRYGSGGAVVVVPCDAPGLEITPLDDVLGCRAAGHAGLVLDNVRVRRENLLDSAGAPLSLLATVGLTYGRMSVAWGCVGILDGCLGAAVRHATTREQFGRALSEHQLVAGHLADLYVAGQVARRICEHASRCWDEGSPELATAAVLAKHVSATQAATGAATAVQVLGGAGARDSSLVARAYRDAKLMEIIEGSNELSRLALAEDVVRRAPRPGGTR